MGKLLYQAVFNDIDKGDPFNNWQSKTNGEYDLLNRIIPYTKLIFDVGCRDYSEMLTLH